MPTRRVIGLLVNYAWGRFFELVLSGIQSVARRHGVDVLVVSLPTEQAAQLGIAKDRVEGWMVLSFSEGIDRLAPQGKPVVTICTQSPGRLFPAVLPHNQQGIADVIEHLYAQGHRRIAFVGHLLIGDIQERYESYKAMLEKLGIPFDPALVVDSIDPNFIGGERAAEQLIAAGISCSAIVFGNDPNALGAMSVLQRHGYRIPDDIAIVGFDDIPESQVCMPTLSTVRQRFDELGVKAAELLLAQLAGTPVAAGAHYVGTTFLPRQSSYTTAAGTAMPLLQQEANTAPWLDSFAVALAQRIAARGDSDLPPTESEFVVLADLLMATINGTIQPQQTTAAIRRVLTMLLAVNRTPEEVWNFFNMVEQQALPIIKQRTDAQASLERFQVFHGEVFAEILRFYRSHYDARNRAVDDDVNNLYHISQQLISSNPAQLQWLRHTRLMSGCFARWSEHSDQNLTVVGCYHRDGTPSVLEHMVVPIVQFPPAEAMTVIYPDSSTHILVDVRTAQHHYGFLIVTGQFVHENAMWMEQMSQPLNMIRSLLASALEREELQENLRRSSDYEQALVSQIRELSCPVIPLMQDVLLIPLIGTIDAQRGEQILVTILEGIGEYQASEVMLDISGVPLVDTQAAQMLLRVAQAAILLGAQVTLVGIRPEIAQSIIALGIDLQRIRFQASLAAAITALARRMPMRAVR